LARLTEIIVLLLIAVGLASLAYVTIELREVKKEVTPEEIEAVAERVLFTKPEIYI